jgi:hAT family C-terminal dimerisation region
MVLFLVLHPRHKLKYFERAGWEPEWTAAAKDIIRAEFDRSYAAQPEDIQEDEDEDDEMNGTRSSNIFDNLPALAAPRVKELRDELDRYLSTDPEHIADVLMWWTEKKSMYPHLSRMALDYLSIPGELLAYTSATLANASQIQLHPSTWNTFSARVGSYYLIFGTVCLHSQFVQSCVSAIGASLGT